MVDVAVEEGMGIGPERSRGTWKNEGRERKMMHRDGFDSGQEERKVRTKEKKKKNTHNEWEKQKESTT